MKTKIDIKIINHRSTQVFALSFQYDKNIIEICKNTGAKWSNSKGVWYYPLDSFKLDSIISYFKEKATLNLKHLKKMELMKSKTIPLKIMLSKEQKEHLNTFFKYLQGKRFSKSTVSTYTSMVAEFIIYTTNDKPIDQRSIEIYAENVLVAKNSAISTHRQFISAMKHYLTFINADFDLDFKSIAPKKDKKLPNVLSKEEVIELIRVTKNLKHRVCITLLYSSGLRIGELLHLKLHNIDIERKLLKVQNGKGRKDRYVPIASSIMPMLHNYITTYNPQNYLIESLEPGTNYSAVSIRKFLKKSCTIAKITKAVTPHTLRHSYATHLLENGTDIRYIQVLLGHAKPETTMIYTHVRSQDLQEITNPLDFIVKQLDQRKKIN